MQGLILAAGKGTRLAEGRPKALAELCGLTLIERSILTLRSVGIMDIVVVVGYQAKEVRRRVGSKDFGVKLTFVENADYDKGNGLSVLKAASEIKARTILIMTDHVFEPDSVRGILRAKGDLVVGIDTNPRFIDVQEATKVKVEAGKLVGIGKELKGYDGVDAGIFVMEPVVFGLLRERVVGGEDNWSDCVGAIASEIDVMTHDLNGSFWCDIDTPVDLANAEKSMLSSLAQDTDGVVSRRLNRKLSIKITQTLMRTSITPNQITAFTLLLALLATVLFTFNSYVCILVAGILVQFSSIIDGCDGEIARLKFMGTKYGAWFDACVDRYADAAIIIGMTYGVWLNKNLGWLDFLSYHYDFPSIVLIVGLLALLGSIMVSYSRARYETSYGQKYESYRLGATRDVRLFIIMIVALLNQIFIGLITLAIICHLEVFRRLLRHTR
jgi:CDP-L-myo-inositol myo-inositolphosphotransferase